MVTRASILQLWQRSSWERRSLILLAVVALTRLFAALLVTRDLGLAGDEAYYWDWGRSPDWGYYSKPPMIGWIMGLLGKIAGPSPFAVRCVALVISTTTLWLIGRLVTHLLSARLGFISMLCLALTPGHLALSLFLTIDAPLMLFWVAALLAFWQATRQPTSLHWWLALSLCIGGGLLTKQIMLLMPVLLALFCLVSPTDRRILALPWFWASLLGSLLFLVPVLLWQQQHQWITLAHTAEHFHAGQLGWVRWFRRTLEWPLIQMLIHSPVLVLAAVAAMVGMSRELGKAARGKILLWVFCAPALLAFSLLALRQRINPNWPAVFCMPALVLGISWLFPEKGSNPSGQRQRWRQWLQRSLITMAATAHVALALVTLTPLRSHPKISELVGWSEVGEQLAQQLAACPKPQQTRILALGHRYLAAQLAFNLPGNPRCYRFEPNGQISSQYEIWPGLESHIGEDVLMVSPMASLPPGLASRFDSVEPRAVLRLRSRTLHVFLGRQLRQWDAVGQAGGALDLDVSLMRLINRQWAHPWLDWLMPVLSALELWALPLGLLAMVALWMHPRRWGQTLALLALTLLISDALVGRSLKKWANRPRPRDCMEGLLVRDLAPASYSLARWGSAPVSHPSRVLPETQGGRSFPSNHVMNLFAAATWLGLHRRSLGWIAFAVAAAVAYSRVYCAAHWPSDLPPSMAMGVLCALLVQALAKGWLRSKAP